MHARVVTVQYQPGKEDEAIEDFRESILPELKQEAGFQGITQLVDRSNHKVVGFVLYQTEAHLQAAGTSFSHPTLQARLARISSSIAAPPLVETYEVVLQE